MLDFSIEKLVTEVGEVCIAKNALSTLSRAFSVAKPIASLEYKSTPDGGDAWVSSVVVEGCEWPRVVFAKVNLLTYLLERKPHISILDVLGDDTINDKYVHSFVQDLQQPFPVYPTLEEHLLKAYGYFADHLIDKFTVENYRKVFRADQHSMYVRLDVLSFDALKEVVKKAPVSLPVNFIEGDSTKCILNGNGGIITITDSPSVSFLKEISSSDGVAWVYIDHGTQHLAGRVVEFKITE